MDGDILLFDIGNTSIKVGLANSDGVYNSYTLRTDAGQTADSLGLTLTELLRHAGIESGKISAALCSSVVPSMNPLLREAGKRFLGLEPRFVPENLPVPLENRYERPMEVGADRLVTSFAARQFLPDADSIICVDFGTATTFDCISGQAYLGGLIFPGVATAAGSLFANAAKLPRVSLEVAEDAPSPCRDTSTSINHGMIFGFAAMSEGLIARLAKNMPGKTEAIATGGFAPRIARVSSCFDHVLPELLLEGLRLLYFKNQH